jgi:tripartite-type tricarboxylate transporter receptor subunit TctC
MLSASLYAQDSYPDRPVSIIVPITPGGPNDLVARYLAERLSMRMHGNFVVENRPGGSHIIGMNQVARAKPDGYTLLQASSNMSMNPAVRDDLPFDSEVDFQAISLTHETPLAVSVGSALNINTLADLVEMATLLLLSKLGLNGLQEVAYRGSSQAHPDLISNRIDFMIDPVAAVLPHVKNNRLKILAVTTSERLALVPYVPTVAEALGIDYRVTSWGGIFAPKGTSQEIVQKLNRDLAAILNDQSTKTRMLELGLIARNSTPQELEVHVSSEINQWKKVVADAK